MVPVYSKKFWRDRRRDDFPLQVKLLTPAVNWVDDLRSYLPEYPVMAIFMPASIDRRMLLSAKLEVASAGLSKLAMYFTTNHWSK